MKKATVKFTMASLSESSDIGILRFFILNHNLFLKKNFCAFCGFNIKSKQHSDFQILHSFRSEKDLLE